MGSRTELLSDLCRGDWAFDGRMREAECSSRVREVKMKNGKRQVGVNEIRQLCLLAGSYQS